MADDSDWVDYKPPQTAAQDDWVDYKPERGALERAGHEMAETFRAGASHAAHMLDRPEPGVGGALENLKATGLGLLSPLTMTVGPLWTGAESLVTSAMAPAARGVGTAAAAAAEAAGYPETAERLRQQRPTTEQAYEALRPGVSQAFTAMRPGPVAPKIVPGRGPEAEAGRIIERSATDAAAARQALETAPREVVPGSQPTTYQLTNDPGLGQLERAAQTRSYAPF
jgi:hypothetical protein